MRPRRWTTPAQVLEELEDDPEVQLLVETIFSTSNGFTLARLAATGVAGTFLDRPSSLAGSRSLRAPARRPTSHGTCRAGVSQIRYPHSGATSGSPAVRRILVTSGHQLTAASLVESQVNSQIEQARIGVNSAQTRLAEVKNGSRRQDIAQEGAVHGETGPSQPPRSLRTDRMEALSDGVFGFAMTLLVVDIVVRPPGTPLHQMLRAWPSLVAYVLSFLTIGAAWMAHTALTDRFERTGSIFLRLNLLTLLVVVFLPFPTGLVADALRSHVGEREAVTLYGLTLLAIRVMGFALVVYARHENLYPRHGGDEELR